MSVKVIHKETGKEATALRWNLHAMSELILGFGENGMDSDFAHNWVCTCHNLPLSEGDNGEVLCSAFLKEGIEVAVKRIRESHNYKLMVRLVGGGYRNMSYDSDYELLLKELKGGLIS